MRFTKILIGLVLIYAAWHLHSKAVSMTDRAIDAPRTIHDPMKPGRARDFFGEDPREVAKTPKAQAELANARRVEQMALLSAIAGVALVLTTVFRRNRMQITPQRPTPTTKEVTP